MKTGTAMMVARAFVDTNMILRAFHREFAEHTRVKTLFDRMILGRVELYISRQVIREYLVQATHPRTFAREQSIEAVSQHLEKITQVCAVLDDDTNVTGQLLNLLKTHPTRGKQIHDTNIVATMLANEIDTLLTLNVADFQRHTDRITLITV